MSAQTPISTPITMSFHELMKAKVAPPAPKKSFIDVMKTHTDNKIDSELVNLETYDVNNLTFTPVEKKINPWGNNNEFYTIGIKSSPLTSNLLFKVDSKSFGISKGNSIRTVLVKDTNAPTSSELYVIKQLRRIEQKCKEYLLTIKDDIELPLLTMEFLNEHKCCELLLENTKYPDQPFINSSVNKSTIIYNSAGRETDKSEFAVAKLYKTVVVFNVRSINVYPAKISINTFIEEVEIGLFGTERKTKKSYLY